MNQSFLITAHTDLPAGAMDVRRKVFVEEQGFFDEWDEQDKHSLHLLLSVDGEAVGTCRVFYGEKHGSYLLGRLAVCKDFRGKGFGVALMEAAEAEVKKLGGDRLLLHAQKRAEGFYAKLGSASTGAEDEEEGCPHVWMAKTF